MTRMLWAALVAAACGSCSSPTTPKVPTPGSGHPPADAAPAVVVPADAAPLDHDLPRLAERSVKLYQDVVAAFQAAGEDCSSAATKLNELRQTYADVVTANATVLHENRARELREALKPHEAQLDAAAKAIMESKTLSKCAQDGTFARAFDELVGAPP
jgi:uncharacterized protein (DUF4415 family)